MTLLELCGVLKRYRWLILATTAAVTLAAALHAAFARPIYSAIVVMSPLAENDEEGTGIAARLGSQLGNAIGLGSLMSGIGAAKGEALALLNARQFTEEFIRERQLLPVLFASKWDANQGKWRVPPADVPTLEDAYLKFDKHIRSINEDEKTGLVTLEIRWFDRDQAADWANALVERLNARIRQRTIQEADRSVRYLNQQLELTSAVEVRQSIFELVERNIRRGMLANVRDQFAFRVVDPALPADPDKFVSPRRVLDVSLGIVVGFFAGLVIAVSHSLLRGGAQQRPVAVRNAV
jgi:capsular polysaccharide biosynthesis protein